MTTIAWRNGVLAADRKGSEDNTAYRTRKLHRTGNYAIAFSGNAGCGMKFVKWFNKKEGKCPLDKETNALVMDLTTGQCWKWDEEGWPHVVEDRFIALGSGGDIALGAMAMNASAIEAVEVASEWDNNSGLGINYAKSRKFRAKEKKQS